MATAFSSRFDPIEYAKQLRGVGVSQEQADIQAQTMEKVISDVLDNQDLATKKDLGELKTEIKNDLRTVVAELKVDLIKWILGTGIAAVVALVSILKYVH